MGFYDSGKLAEPPDTLQTIKDRAFELCSGMQVIRIPANVTTIGNEVFDGCHGLAGN